MDEGWISSMSLDEKSLKIGRQDTITCLQYIWRPTRDNGDPFLKHIDYIHCNDDIVPA